MSNTLWSLWTSSYHKFKPVRRALTRLLSTSIGCCDVVLRFLGQSGDTTWDTARPPYPSFAVVVTPSYWWKCLAAHVHTVATEAIWQFRSSLVLESYRVVQSVPRNGSPSSCAVTTVVTHTNHRSCDEIGWVTWVQFVVAFVRANLTVRNFITKSSTNCLDFWFSVSTTSRHVLRRYPKTIGTRQKQHRWWRQTPWRQCLSIGLLLFVSKAGRRTSTP